MRGLGDLQKRRRVFNYLKQLKSDVFLLQETHSTVESEELWRKQWRGSIFFSHGESNARGVCVLVKDSLDATIKVASADPEGRYLVLEVEINHRAITVCNVYAPNKDDTSYFEGVFKEVEKTETAEKVIGGDFNLTLNNEIDRKGSDYNHHKAANYINNYLEVNEMTDIWRHCNKDIREFSWMRVKQGKVRSHFARLDFFLCSDSLVNRVVECSMKPGYNTDHSIVQLFINNTDVKRGKGMWKFNTKHLTDATYVQGIKKILHQSAVNYERYNPLTKWEMMKCDAIGYSKVYAIEKSKKKNERLNTLKQTEQYLTSLLQQMEGDLDTEICTELEDVKTQIDSYMREKTQTLMFLSKTQWHMEGEKSSKFFFSLAKSRNTRKTMYEIQLDNGSITRDPTIIMDEQFKFYSNLYQKNNNVKFNLRNDTEFKLTENDSAALDRKITPQEIKEAIQQFPTNKTPGLDGLPPEWYSTFMEDILEHLHAAYVYAFEHGLLHISARRGYLMLIPKKNRNLLKLKQWRPLSILSTDYKVLSKILDNRLKKVLNCVIQDYQTGFMEGRYILTNILKLMDVMQYAHQQN